MSDCLEESQCNNDYYIKNYVLRKHILEALNLRDALSYSSLDEMSNHMDILVSECLEKIHLTVDEFLSSLSSSNKISEVTNCKSAIGVDILQIEQPGITTGNSSRSL